MESLPTLICATLIVLQSCKFMQSRTNTFQGILIADGSSSYAVFIYECGGMEWGGGVIGWQESLSQYNSHSLSGDSNSNDVGCLYSTTYSAVVFKIDDGKYRYRNHLYKLAPYKQD